MKYNTQKERLILSDYGRTIQDMVRYAMTIEDRDKRTQCAHTIVHVMATLTGCNLSNESHNQKLWDHLIEISNYQLDVDTPVAITPQEQRSSRPSPLPYPTKRIHARHYGANVEAALERIANMPEGDERELLTALTANQMKRLLVLQGSNNSNDDRVFNDLSNYTRGHATLPNSFHFANPNTKCTQGSNAIIGCKKKKKK